MKALKMVVLRVFWKGLPLDSTETYYQTTVILILIQQTHINLMEDELTFNRQKNRE